MTLRERMGAPAMPGLELVTCACGAHTYGKPDPKGNVTCWMCGKPVAYKAPPAAPESAARLKLEGARRSLRDSYARLDAIVPKKDGGR